MSRIRIRLPCPASRFHRAARSAAAVFRARLTDRRRAAASARLPPARPRGGRGRPPADDRACLEGILFVLRAGCRWRDVPDGLPSGVTCRRRLRDWRRAGRFAAMWAAFLAELTARGRVGRAEPSADGTCVPAKKGGRSSAGAAGGPARG